MPSLCQHFNFQASKQMKFQDSVLSVNFIHDKITDPPFVCGVTHSSANRLQRMEIQEFFLFFYLDLLRRQTRSHPQAIRAAETQKEQEPMMNLNTHDLGKITHGNFLLQSFF